MERGLLWLPLLGVFIWLVWSGWNEYQKVEGYRIWSEQFDKAKYDLLAVLGKKGSEITWGNPTRKGILNLNNFSLQDVQKIDLLVGNNSIKDLDALPNKGKPVLNFTLNNNNSIKIPFTDISLAAQWTKYLQQEWQQLQN
ncbi:hypothetical protein STA3757_37270 [Stanieria sp. NIES-3757]|nr:hypothetical protein STA3757_37270 [Stanieria sp. NIES-3757]